MEGYVEEYGGQQYVGMDLHRRRSVIVRTTEAGEVLESVQITNSPLALAEVMSRAGQAPEVVLESAYGWYWAVDCLQALENEPVVHLAHPLGVKAFEYRRVKNDHRDAVDLADLLRLGRLPEAWIAPPATRELRETIRHRAKLVAMRSHCKAQVHAVLASCGVSVPMSDLFGVAGTQLLKDLQDGRLRPAFAAKIASLCRVIDLLDFEIDIATGITRGRLASHPGYVAVQTIPGIGPVLAAVFVAEIGDIARFAGPDKLVCWAGMTPKHRESDTKVRRGRITKQGSRLVRWAAVESVQRLAAHTAVGAFRDQVAARRGRNIAVVAAARRQLHHVYYALRDHRVRALEHLAGPGKATMEAPVAQEDLAS